MGLGGEPLRQRAGAFVRADACEGGLRCGEEEGLAASIVGVEPDFVGVVDACASAAGDADADDDLVVVTGWGLVVDGEARDDEEDAGLFEVRVGDAADAEEFGAGDLEPGRVGGVVCESHGIALVVADAETDFGGARDGAIGGEIGAGS